MCNPRCFLGMTVAWLAMGVELSGQVASTETSDQSHDVLSVVPGDAWAVVSVRELDEVDRKVAEFAQRVGFGPLMNGTLMVAKAFSGLSSGVDDARGLAIVLLPLADAKYLGQSLALIVPVKDYDAIRSLLMPEEEIEGIGRISFLGQPSHIGRRGGFAVFAQTREAVRAVVQAADSMATKMQPLFRERVNGDDVTVYLNAAAIVSSPAFQKLIDLQALHPVAADLFRQADELVLSATIKSEGIGLRGMFALSANSPWSACVDGGSSGSRGSNGSNGSKSGLHLPADDSTLIAMDMAVSARQSECLVGKLRASMGPGEKSGEAKADGGESKWRGLVERLADVRIIQLSVSAIGEGADGNFHVAMVIGSAGSARNMLDAISGLFLQSRSPVGAQSRVDEILAGLTYQRQAELIDEVHVDHLNWPIPGEVQRDAADSIRKLFGDQGPVARLAVMDSDHLVMSLGGGRAAAETLLRAIRAGGAADTRTQYLGDSSMHLPGDHWMEFFIAVDACLRWYADLEELVGGRATITLPRLNSPVAISFSSLQNSSADSNSANSIGRLDVFLPAELVDAAYQAWLKHRSIQRAAPSEKH